MKSKSAFLGLIVIICSYATMAAPPSYVQNKEGVTVFTNSKITGTSQAVRLEVITPNIIRVLAWPGNKPMATQSLITSYQKKEPVPFSLINTKDELVLKTASVQAHININTGAVRFADKQGKPVLSELPVDSRRFEETVYEGKRSYQLCQTFKTTATEAWYGLGQHQDGVLNYKGHQVSFFQNNGEVAVPLLVSSNNYGVLWDNYSFTRVGNLSPLHPLGALQLFSARGEQGWLTARYANNQERPQEVLLERPESKIDMEFLGDSRLQLPAGFTPAKGMVTYEGSIASHLEGAHQLRFTFGGTLRLWLDNKLVFNHWRKAWNPAPAWVPVHLQPNKKARIKIEWVPEGGESYLSLKWQEPVTPEKQQLLSFHSEAGQQIDYYFIQGQNMDEVISGYRTLTGKAPIVPKWALGFWQSRERYKTQQELLDVVAEFRKRKIPLDNIVLDWSYWPEAEWGSQDFDKARFPKPDAMIEELHQKFNTQIMISVWPKFYEGIEAYKHFDKNGWLYRRNVANRQRDWIGEGYVGTFYDAFDPDARHAFWKLIHDKIYTKGIDAWWMDASEPDILSNTDPEHRKQQMTPTAAGLVAENMNAYPLLNAKGIYEGQRNHYPNRRVFLLTRSGFAGSQRYAAAIWSGDIGTTWLDMKNQIAAGVNFSMSGIPYWTMDIGGFVVPEKFEKPNAESLEEWRELNARWYQFGAFVPLFRAHGQYPFREIYNIAPETHQAYKTILYYNQLRYRLMPYLYAMAGAAYHTDYTIMRGLAMDFGADTTVLNINDQYMFGPSLLINPVYGYKQRERSLYLPRHTGGWYDLYTGQWQAGGRQLVAEAPYERMPIYVKAGSILPFGPALEYVAQKPADTIQLNVYAGANGQFELYEDEELNYNYEQGGFATISLKYNNASRTLTIDNRKGSFEGLRTQKVFKINLIEPGKPMVLNPNASTGKMVVYQGNKVSITL